MVYVVFVAPVLDFTASGTTPMAFEVLRVNLSDACDEREDEADFVLVSSLFVLLGGAGLIRALFTEEKPFGDVICSASSFNRAGVSPGASIGASTGCAEGNAVEFVVLVSGLLTCSRSCCAGSGVGDEVSARLVGFGASLFFFSHISTFSAALDG